MRILGAVDVLGAVGVLLVAVRVLITVIVECIGGDKCIRIMGI